VRPRVKTPSKQPPSKQTPAAPAAAPSSSGDVAAFIRQVNALGPAGTPGERGRLLFALDATMSRQPTWDLACKLQAEMFATLAGTQGLEVQLLYFRGFGECKASKWMADAAALGRVMTGIQCRGGNTQIGKVFAHARAEHGRKKINAVVFVGDALEENVDRLAQQAGELGLLGCPIFIFHEGHDPLAGAAFKEFARVSKGAYARFDASAPRELAALLRAVAAYAAGGRAALMLQQTPPARLLLQQLH